MKHKEKQKIITPNNTSRIPQTLPICSLKHISLPEMSTFKHVCLFINYSYLHIEVYKVYTYSPKIFLHFLPLHAYFNLCNTNNYSIQAPDYAHYYSRSNSLLSKRKTRILMFPEKIEKQVCKPLGHHMNTSYVNHKSIFYTKYTKSY